MIRDCTAGHAAAPLRTEVRIAACHTASILIHATRKTSIDVTGSTPEPTTVQTVVHFALRGTRTVARLLTLRKPVVRGVLAVLVKIRDRTAGHATASLRTEVRIAIACDSASVLIHATRKTSINIARGRRRRR